MLPQIIASGVQLVVGLLSGIAQALPSIITAGLSMIQTLVQGIVQSIPLILQAAIQGIIAFVQAAISLSSRVVMILHPVTPTALHPSPMHIVRA